MRWGTARLLKLYATRGLLHNKPCAAEAAGLHFFAGGLVCVDDLAAFVIGGLLEPVLLKFIKEVEQLAAGLYAIFDGACVRGEWVFLHHRAAGHGFGDAAGAVGHLLHAGRHWRHFNGRRRACGRCAVVHGRLKFAEPECAAVVDAQQAVAGGHDINFDDPKSGGDVFLL